MATSCHRRHQKKNGKHFNDPAGHTHAWIWWVSRRIDLLPAALAERISREGSVAVASVSCLEVALLAKKGRIVLSDEIDDWLSLALDGSSIELLPLTPSIAARSAVLPDIHKDPIDRVLVATAIEHDAVLHTKDEHIRQYEGVQAQWV